jgi:hypothetical protein
MATLLVDAIGADSAHIPVTVPKVGIYTTGQGIAWTEAERARFTGHSGEALIDQEATDALAGGATVKDSETGAASIANVVATAKRFGAKAFATYIQRSNLETCRAALAAEDLVGMTYAVADWNLTEAQAIAMLGGDIVWVQYASPTSNPNTILPGTNLTLREANADLGVTVDSWHALVTDPKPKGIVRFEGTFDMSTGHWTLTPQPGETKLTWGAKEAAAGAEIQIGTGGASRGRWRLKPLPWNSPPLG